MKRHTLVVLVEDHPGVLNRVVSLLRRRSFNIDSITVGQSEQPGVSRMTLVVRAKAEDVEQVSKQLYKLMEVLKVQDLSESSSVAHELVMVKVACKPQNRSELLQIAQIFEARVVDVTPNTLLLEAVGTEERMEGLLTMLRGFGIRELGRTGPIAMARGANSIAIRENPRAVEHELAVAGNGSMALVN